MAFRIKPKLFTLTLSAVLASSMVLSTGVVSAQAVSISDQELANVIIDGRVQHYPQSAVVVNGRTLSP